MALLANQNVTSWSFGQSRAYFVFRAFFSLFFRVSLEKIPAYVTPFVPIRTNEPVEHPRNPSWVDLIQIQKSFICRLPGTLEIYIHKYTHPYATN